MPINDASFAQLGRLTQRLQSTISGPGVIKFVDQEGAGPIVINATDTLTVGDLRASRLVEASLTAEKDLQIRMIGTMGLLASGLPGAVIDRRLTLFDVIWHNPKLVALFTIVVWILPTLISTRKFLLEQDAAKPL